MPPAADAAAAGAGAAGSAAEAGVAGVGSPSSEAASERQGKGELTMPELSRIGFEVGAGGGWRTCRGGYVSQV